MREIYYSLARILCGWQATLCGWQVILCGWQPYFAGGNHTLRMVTYFANSNIILSENN